MMTLSRRIQKGTSLQIGARLFSAATNFVLSAVLLARVLTEGEFGLYQFYLTLFLLTMTLVDFGVNRAGVRMVAAKECPLGDAVIAAIALKAIAGGFAFLVLAMIALLAEPEGVTGWLLVLAAVHVLSHAAGSASIGFEVRLDFRVPAIGMVAGHTLFLLLGLLLYFCGVRHAAPYLVAWGAGIVSQNLLVLGAAWKRDQLGRRPDRQVLLQLAREALPLGVAAIAVALYFHMDTIMLRPLKGPEEVAEYAVAYRMMTVGLMVPALFMQVVFPVLTRCHEASADLLRAVLRQCTFYMALIGGVAAAILLALAPELLALAFGEAYREAAPSLRILGLAMAAVFLCYPHSMVLIAAGQAARFTRITLLAALLNLALNLLLIPRFGAEGAAGTTLTTEMLVLLASALAVRRHVGVTGVSARLIGVALLAGTVLLANQLLGSRHPFLVNLPVFLLIALLGAALLKAWPLRIGVEEEEIA
ncbi:MAG: oligosaccharide flippase family protein [Planctomycetota bacterium]